MRLRAKGLWGPAAYLHARGADDDELRVRERVVVHKFERVVLEVRRVQLRHLWSMRPWDEEALWRYDPPGLWDYSKRLWD